MDKASQPLTVEAEAISALARILNESGLTEIEYRQGETLIRVVKTPAPIVSAVTAVSPTPAPLLETQAAPVAAASPPSDNRGTPVKSPLVGTVYLAPDPSAPPFVKVGDRVQVGQTLMIIEAMKVMNPIKATVSGEITDIRVTNGGPVEFGEALLYMIS